MPRQRRDLVMIKQTAKSRSRPHWTMICRGWDGVESMTRGFWNLNCYLTIKYSYKCNTCCCLLFLVSSTSVNNVTTLDYFLHPSPDAGCNKFGLWYCDPDTPTAATAACCCCCHLITRIWCIFECGVRIELYLKREFFPGKNQIPWVSRHWPITTIQLWLASLRTSLDSQESPPYLLTGSPMLSLKAPAKQRSTKQVKTESENCLV